MEQQISEYYGPTRSNLYDLTRWYLYGRSELVNRIYLRNHSPRILEVGAGTGYITTRLADRYPNGEFHLIDSAPGMLSKAIEKLKRTDVKFQTHCKDFLNEYNFTFQEAEKYDCIVLGYSLSMMPAWHVILEKCRIMLKPGGVLAVVDFHTANKAYEQYLKQNHVIANARMLPMLKHRTQTYQSEIKPGFLNIWRYFLFTGTK